ncbi:DUF1120 domain-containing protein [Leclercia adecarboxylata]|uniref:DUF1120 domain-containing protein n=1 Tax=Leclercia adecarboxylata TaxID=83655 RepID=UPI002DB800FD|nr:DUF1120 domain-containing protein [Leclercia adecarboxylata]MEB6380718.1 DUF1120 domain-containing protein [Leclercia adecarboxylata]
MRHVYLLLAALTTASVSANDSVGVDFELTADAAACTPALSNNGVADFGSRNAGSLSANAYTQLGTRDLTLTIACESSTALAVTARDTRRSSVSIGEDAERAVGPHFNHNGSLNVGYASRLFGLGVTAENKRIGSYAILIKADSIVALDGSQNVNVDMAGSETKSGPWSRLDHYLLPATESYFYTFVKKGTVVPQAVSSVSVPLQVSVAVANKLGSSQQISLDGEAVISIVYL